MLSNPYKRLIKYGFYKSQHKDKYGGKTIEEREDMLRTTKDSDALEHADVEIDEEYLGQFIPTDYPQPIKRFWLASEAPNNNPETTFNWFHHNLTVEMSMEVTKIIDAYASSEGSSFFGMMQQRLSIQQGNVSGYLKGISEMVKGLFQIVREIRILNDRLQYYLDTFKQNEKTVSSEIVLRGLWVDQVEGGTKNPGSVYGLSSQVGFTILPDIFFRLKCKDSSDVDRAVDELQLNEKIKEILRRKLRQYYEWKERSFSELDTRRKFMLKYLRQHYETIRLYISWIKPYLRYVNRMQQSEKLENKSDMIKSFEGAYLEIEFLGKRKTGKYNIVVIINLQNRTRPETIIHQPHDYSQKGPLHVGRTNIRIRSYVWTDDQVKNYVKFRQEEDIALLSSIDDSIQEALNSLGDELQIYLGLEGEKFGEGKKVEELAKGLINNNICSTMDEALVKAEDMLSKSKIKPRQSNAFDPFLGVFYGLRDMVGAFGFKGISMPKKSGGDTLTEDKEKKSSKDTAQKSAFVLSKNYKKSNKMLTW